MTSTGSRTDEGKSLHGRKALSQWDNEGGAHPDNRQAAIPEMTNTELVHLRIRVISLENLLIAILSEGSDQQLAVARDMASYISPRAGFTQHPLTVKAAEQMNEMLERAKHYRTLKSP